MAHRIWCPFILIIISVIQGLCEDEDESEYKAAFADSFHSCPDFNNENLDTSMVELKQKASDDEDGSGSMSMQGYMNIKFKLSKGYTISFLLEKETDDGCEIVMESSMEFCGCAEEEDAPWSSVFQSLGIEGCPVEVGNYTFPDSMELKLGAVEQMMNHDTCGNYICTLKIFDTTNKCMSCHILAVSIYPV